MSNGRNENFEILWFIIQIICSKNKKSHSNFIPYIVISLVMDLNFLSIKNPTRMLGSHDRILRSCNPYFKQFICLDRVRGMTGIGSASLLGSRFCSGISIFAVGPRKVGVVGRWGCRCCRECGTCSRGLRHPHLEDRALVFRASSSLGFLETARPFRWDWYETDLRCVRRTFLYNCVKKLVLHFTMIVTNTIGSSLIYCWHKTKHIVLHYKFTP